MISLIQFSKKGYVGCTYNEKAYIVGFPNTKTAIMVSKYLSRENPRLTISDRMNDNVIIQIAQHLRLKVDRKAIAQAYIENQNHDEHIDDTSHIITMPMQQYCELPIYRNIGLVILVDVIRSKQDIMNGILRFHCHISDPIENLESVRSQLIATGLDV